MEEPDILKEVQTTLNITFILISKILFPVVVLQSSVYLNFLLNDYFLLFFNSDHLENSFDEVLRSLIV